MTGPAGELRRIHLILLMREPGAQDMLGPPVWAVFEEVERLFNLTQPLAEFSRSCITADLPRRLAGRVPPEEVVKLTRYDWGDLWSGCEGVYPDTIDQRRLAEQVEVVLSSLGRQMDTAVVVTDQEMTPPKTWRYILWDTHDDVRVVSLAAMDPEYWGITDPDRLTTIKHRARAGCVCTTGMALGMDRCQNEQCFLFENVDSVSRLDVMRTIGPEHEEYPANEAVGYHVRSDNPAIQQDVAWAKELRLTGWPPP